MNYDNTNKGALFRNKDKKSEKHPDYRGSINVAEDEYWLSAWLQKSKAGETYMSLSVTPKEASKSVEEEPQESFNDDIPF